ncbi:MAG: HutD family protein [Candidatus Adiutrix sp.]
MNIYKPSDYTRMPWKNGLGSTCQIAREPIDEQQAFIWRLSIADVTTDGPFSIFAGYRRIISTLSGAGMVLTVDGQKSPPLVPYQPFMFSGDSQVEGKLIDGPICDFNLIYQAKLVKPRVQWLKIKKTQSVVSAASTIFIFTLCPLDVNVKILPANSINSFQIQNQETLKLTSASEHLSHLEISPLKSDLPPHLCLIEFF